MREKMHVPDLSIENWEKKEHVKPEDVYKEATYYLQAAYMLDSEREEDCLFPPVLMNALFACELFSKAILYLINKSDRIKTHCLKNLYDCFPDKIRKRLVDILSYSTKKDEEVSGIDVEADEMERMGRKRRIESYINDISRAFELWRYRFEYKRNNCHWSFVFDYAKALKNVYLEITANQAAFCI